MAWTDPTAVTSLLAVSLVVAAAVVVLRRGARREINHRLFWVLVYEALFLLVLAVNATRPWPNAGSSITSWLAVVSRFTVPVLLVVQAFYLRFLARLQSPLSAPFRSFWGWVIVAPFIALGIAIPLLVTLQWSPPSDLLPIRWIYIVNFGPIVTVFAVALYGLAVVVDAYLRTPHSSPRRRGARSLVWAFGTRDGLWALLLLLILVGLPMSEAAEVASSDGSGGVTEGSMLEAILEFVVDVGPALISIAFIGFLAYGVLVNQMFDIDLRVKKWTRRGVWAGLGAVVFFIATESLEAVLGMSNLLPGLVAAGIATLALWPLHRVAGAVTERLFPGVFDSAKYRLLRKAEVYRALAEELEADGHLSAADHATLAALLKRLGLSEEDLERIEKSEDLRGRGPESGRAAIPPG